MDVKIADQDFLDVKRLRKSFPGVRALDGVSLSCRRGEVRALIGENGAGKSTLIKSLCGALKPDDGEIWLDGQLIAPRSPIEAQELGISTIFQEFNLVGGLSAAENIFLGRERTQWGFIKRREMLSTAEALLERIGARIDLRRLVRELSIAEQQLLEIAKALVVKAKVVVMDEPTATLSEAEVSLLFDVIRRLKAEGVTILYISHRLEEIFEICRGATVLKDGRLVGTVDVAAVTRGDLVRMMVGRELEHMLNRRDHQTKGSPVLQVSELSATAINEVSLTVRASEIVGIAGLVGAGRTEFARVLFGAESRVAGRIIVHGREVDPRSPREAIAAGLALVPEDRKRQGLVLTMSVAENVTLVVLKKLLRFGFINFRTQAKLVQDSIQSLRIAASDRSVSVRTLSGGNQQKVVLAKWLASDFQILILDEPTRGIDVGAKAEIYRLISEIARAGKGVIVISSELPEILGLCDRIYAMREGQITGELVGGDATEESILELIAG